MQCVVVQVDSTGRGALKVGYEYQTLVNMTRFPVPKSLVQLSQAERARLRVTGPYTPATWAPPWTSCSRTRSKRRRSRCWTCLSHVYR